MRYILDENGYIEEVGSHIMQCNDKDCTAYTGTIPEGYDSLEEWAANENIRAYKIVNNNLTYDADRDAELQEEYKTCDGIIEHGTNDNGNWIKYADGSMICSFTEVVTINVNSSWGSLYQGVVNLHDYPQEFASIPDVSISLLTNSSKWGGWLGVAGKSEDIEPSTTNPGSVSILRPTTGTSAKYKISVQAVGKWKGE